jgi:hypothetical protein
MNIDRHTVARTLVLQGAAAVVDHLADDFAPEGDAPAGLALLRRFLFPQMVIEIEELLDLPDDRVLVQAIVHTTDGPDAAVWTTISIVRFDGDRIVGLRRVQDNLPWLQALGVAPDDAELERRLDKLSGDP